MVRASPWPRRSLLKLKPYWLLKPLLYRKKLPKSSWRTRGERSAS